MTNEEFLEMLVKNKIVTPKQMKKALKRGKDSTSSIEAILIELGVSKERLLAAKAQYIGVEYVDLLSKKVEKEIAHLVPRTMAERYHLICIGKKDNRLMVAMADPEDVFALEYLKMRTGYEIVPLLSLYEDILFQIHQVYTKKEALFAKKEEISTSLERSSSNIVGMGSKDVVEEARFREVEQKKIPKILEIPLTIETRVLPDTEEEKELMPTEEDILSLLCEIGQDLSSTLEIDKLLLKILDSVHKISKAEGASILLYDEERNCLYFKYVTGEKGEELKRFILPLNEESIAGWVGLHRKPLIINDVTQEKRHYKIIDEILQIKTRNIIAIPIQAGERLWGVIEAVNKIEGKKFTDKDLKYLTVLTNQAGIALTNAKLVEELQNYFMCSVELLISAMETLQPLLKSHIIKTAKLSTAIAHEMGITGKELETICYGALLHDVGKLQLTPFSTEEMQKIHPIVGADIIKDIKLLQHIAPLIRTHHEKYDGSGFPDGKKGEEILVGGQILSLVEDFAERVGFNSSSEEIYEFILMEGKHHNRKVLEAFKKVIFKQSSKENSPDKEK